MRKQLVESIRQSSRNLVRELDVLKGVYLDTGCTFLQCHVLFELSAQGPMHLMDVAETLLVDKSNTSRTLKKLVRDGYVAVANDPDDQRQKKFSVTKKGRSVVSHAVDVASQQARDALINLDPEEQEKAVEGMNLYASALRKSRLQTGFEIRKIKKSDNERVAELVRSVLREYGAVGEGYSIVDPEIDDMHGAYRNRKSMYLVIENAGRIVGAAGIAPLEGGSDDVCELRKMFFLPEVRGRGLGYRLLRQLMLEAKKRGYRSCYLETLARMERAIALYEKFGFRKLDAPEGDTGHCACDCWFRFDLET